MATRCFLLTAALVLALAAPVLAQAPLEPVGPEYAGRTLTVGVKMSPPFTFKDAGGHWHGISIDLWRDVASDLGLAFEVREYDLDGLLAAVRDGAVDVGVAALSITPEREAAMDFSLPYHYTGLGIAVSAKALRHPLLVMAGKFLSPEFLLYVGSLALLLLAVGIVIWRMEWRRNPEHFRPGGRGIGDGFWWSAVTMTTVGYGDLAPKTVPGRLLALVWMFASLILVTFFTAGITASLTVERMGDAISGPDDLRRARVGCVAESAAASSLAHAHVAFTRYPDVIAGLEALAAGTVDAVVYDQPIIQYYVHQRFQGRLKVLDAFFDLQLYGFAFPRGSTLRKPVNLSMLQRILDADYRQRLKGPYLGKKPRL